MMKVWIVFLSCSILFLACDKEGYKAYTSTDEFGLVKGDADPTDWTVDDEWVDGIEELIASECTLEGVGTSATVTVHPAYPNPTTANSTLAISVGDTCLFRLVIVDKFNSVYAKTCLHLKAGDNFIALNISGLAASVGGRYRVYYDFLDASNAVFYKGHGDIILE